MKVLITFLFLNLAFAADDFEKKDCDPGDPLCVVKGEFKAPPQKKAPPRAKKKPKSEPKTVTPKEVKVLNPVKNLDHLLEPETPPVKGVKETVVGKDWTYDFSDVDTLNGDKECADVIKVLPPTMPEDPDCLKPYFKKLRDPQWQMFDVKYAYRQSLKCLNPCLEKSPGDKDSRFLVECMDWSYEEKLRTCLLRNQNCDEILLEGLDDRKSECTKEEIELGVERGLYEGWHMDPKTGVCAQKYFRPHPDAVTTKKWAKIWREQFKKRGYKCPTSKEEIRVVKEILNFFRKTQTPFDGSVGKFVSSSKKNRIGLACGFNESSGAWFPEDKFVCVSELQCNLYHKGRPCTTLVRKSKTEAEFRQKGNNCLGDPPWREVTEKSIRAGSDVGIIPIGEGVYIQYGKGKNGDIYHGLLFER